MARPKMERHGDFALWQEIEATRVTHKLTQPEMAHILGISYGAYRTQIARTDGPPVQAWVRYQAYLASYIAPDPEGAYHELLYWDEVRQCYAPVPGSASVIRCSNPNCENGRPRFVQFPLNKIYCTPLCGKRHRRKK